jgi:glycosyltransferase involved in cell wall biosynthesis
MKVALVHDWLVAQRGGEAVLEAIAAHFPDAPIFTLVHRPGSVSAALEAHPIHATWIGKVPGNFRAMLPLFPWVVERWDFSRFDLVISSSHCVVKGIRTPRTRHVSYVHTPMRYLWSETGQYLKAAVAPAAHALSAPLRWWDRHSAGRPHVLLCNSRFVAARIRRFWGREAQVLHPPVDLAYFHGPARPRQGFLVAGALVAYKRVDIAIAAANSIGVPLTVIGDGPERARLERLAGRSVTFLGHVSRAALREALWTHRAVLFPGVEDFGILMVEASAAGCPVIAYGAGGALESVRQGVNGSLCMRQDAAAFAEQMESPPRVDAAAVARHLAQFAPPAFHAGFAAALGDSARV